MINMATWRKPNTNTRKNDNFYSMMYKYKSKFC